jgi:hypothetical protein
MERQFHAAAAACAALAALLTLAGRPAEAQEFEIKSPLVEHGTFEVEWHGAVQSRFNEEDEEEEEGDDDDDDDDEEAEEEEEDEEPVRQAHELAVGYGVTSFWQPELALALEQRKGRDLKVDSVGIENTFQLLPTDAHFVNLGLSVAYEVSVRDEVHGLEFGPLIQLPLGPLSNTANLIFEQQFGDDRESASTAFGYAWQSVYRVVPVLDLGFEAFGEIESFAEDAPSTDEQEHRIGPVAYISSELGGFEFSVGAGFLFGLTDETPDQTFKFDVEIEWGGDDDDDDGDEDEAEEDD